MQQDVNPHAIELARVLVLLGTAGLLAGLVVVRSPRMRALIAGCLAVAILALPVQTFELRDLRARLESYRRGTERWLRERQEICEISEELARDDRPVALAAALGHADLSTLARERLIVSCALNGIDRDALQSLTHAAFRITTDEEYRDHLVAMRRHRSILDVHPWSFGWRGPLEDVLLGVLQGTNLRLSERYPTRFFDRATWER